MFGSVKKQRLRSLHVSALFSLGGDCALPPLLIQKQQKKGGFSLRYMKKKGGNCRIKQAYVISVTRDFDTIVCVFESEGVDEIVKRVVTRTDCKIDTKKNTEIEKKSSTMNNFRKSFICGMTAVISSLLFSLTAEGFVVVSPIPSSLVKPLSSRGRILTPSTLTSSSTTTTTILFLAKGFGSPRSKKRSESPRGLDNNDNEEEEDVDEEENEQETLKQKQQQKTGLNAGQQALQRLRDEETNRREEELRKVKELRSIDEFIRDDPTAAVIPERVATRMGTRMLPFVGIPLFGGMLAFVLFWYLATYKNMEFQPALVAFTTIGLLAVGLVGITYSVMSASWDPDREGSALGTEEFQRNVNSLRQGLRRSRENALIRERMAGMPEEEIEAAVRELDKRDERRRREEESKKGLNEKMKNELE